ncbi:MAG: S8 family peptidase, partial [Planctomycetota bacterium]
MSIASQHVVASALAALALCAANAPGQSAHHRVYKKQPVPLPLDAGRVAVFDAAQKPGAMPELELAPYGIAPDRIEPWPITGWSLATVPVGARNATGVEALVAAVAGDQAADFVSPVFIGEDGGPLFVTPDILVGFHRHIPAARAEVILAASEAGRIADVDYAGMARVYRVRSAATNGFDVLDAANALAVRPEVRFAETDMIFTGHGDAIPDDHGFLNCWGLHNVGLTPDNDMDAPQAWEVTSGDPSIIVAIIDDGVEQDHPDLNQIQGHDVTSQAILGFNGGPVSECDNHGTAVAGCVSATMNNGLGTVGIAPGCKTVSIKTFISNLTCAGWTSQISWTTDALAWARDNGARVSNNSNSYGFTSAAIEQMYLDTHDLDDLVHFASAGNNANGTVVYPASIPVVNACAALDMDGTLTSFSNWGPGLDFSAPGIRIYTTDRTSSDGYAHGDYTHSDGTSFASPYAAGVAALILSNIPSLPASSVETIMQATAIDLGDAGYDETYGWGFVNACAALLGDCSEPCVPGGGDCDIAHGGLGCNDAGCCTRVCEIDPACCDTAWDQTCVDTATQTCTPGTGTTTRVSVDSGGNEGDNNSFWPWTAADAPNLVAFDSRA